MNMAGQLIWTVKYADHLVLLAKEETVVKDMSVKLNENWKTLWNENWM